MNKISISTRLSIFGACIAAAAGLVASTAGAAVSPTCTPTGFYRDSINLTAAQIGGNVTRMLDATGCDIGVYYGPEAKGTVFGAKIANAKYFGVVNDGGNVNVARSTISKIGDTPFDGAQHGVGILYTTEHELGVSHGTARGTIDGNTLSSYQKGGITVRGAGASATIQFNKVTGSGKIDYIAQNGIQVSFGASATIRNNTVSSHFYEPETNEACGLLFFRAAAQPVAAAVIQANHLFLNELDLCIV